MTATALAGVAATGLAAVVAGSAAASGAGIGTAMAVFFFTSGAIVVSVVAKAAPALSLLVALLTYTLEVVLIGLVFVVLNRSGALDGLVDRRWLGGTVIACTTVWLASQIVCAVRAREPVYDTSRRAPQAGVQ